MDENKIDELIEAVRTQSHLIDAGQRTLAGLLGSILATLQARPDEKTTAMNGMTFGVQLYEQEVGKTLKDVFQAGKDPD